ncbi:Methionine aminopeptidase 1D, chloroplastic/mitochondrial [Zancudomyces culisetae]|uniref:Methionine aminopeptidase n=1 Tax=Zancudomyces culisetae TaxID=1213189 RepID=A0A1R1PVH3_ZANCU|nr:Methionine aminopeptidase 1D, chloroplastic/mitochondrial [Zancudomyces culisetae]|eukprot:OMH84882.1 Methionine aminopeptidase 1D, chloroplastic/mitochondrial [Zancudomyces culisetae]
MVEGVTTLEIDTLVRKFIIENEAYPSPLNYYGFPKSICTSINNIVAHGIPDKRKLMDGDIINIDISVYCNGFHGDTSATFCVGNVDQQGLALVEATKKALDIGMNVCGPEVELRQIGNSIENYANEAGYSVNDQYTGHGIGKEFHQNPLIYHFKNDEPGVMKEGMVFTIEPMLNQGTKECIIFPDGWTISTCDGSRSAQFEHTIIITSNGYEILTV